MNQSINKSAFIFFQIFFLRRKKKHKVIIKNITVRAGEPPCAFIYAPVPTLDIVVRTYRFPDNRPGARRPQGTFDPGYQHVLEQVAEARCCRSLVQLIEHAGDGVLWDVGQCE